MEEVTDDKKPEVTPEQRDENLRLTALAQANQPWRGSLPADAIVADATKFYEFLKGKEAEGQTGQYL